MANVFKDELSVSIAMHDQGFALVGGDALMQRHLESQWFGMCSDGNFSCLGNS